MKTKIENILKFLREIELLKSVTRHSWTSSGRQESVAEHSWRMAIFAMALEDEFPDINIKRVIEMSLIHDFGEAHEGDYPAFENQPKNKLEIEEKSVNKIIESLPEKFQLKFKNLWNEYNKCETLEAKLTKALDKLEVLIQHNEADISTWEPPEYDFALTSGTKFMKFDKFITEFRKIVDQQTKDKIMKSKKKKENVLTSG